MTQKQQQQQQHQQKQQQQQQQKIKMNIYTLIVETWKSKMLSGKRKTSQPGEFGQISLPMSNKSQRMIDFLFPFKSRK